MGWLLRGALVTYALFCYLDSPDHALIFSPAEGPSSFLSLGGEQAKFSGNQEMEAATAS